MMHRCYSVSTSSIDENNDNVSRIVAKLTSAAEDLDNFISRFSKID